MADITVKAYPVKECMHCLGRGKYYPHASASMKICMNCFGTGIVVDMTEGPPTPVSGYTIDARDPVAKLESRIADLEARVEAWERLAERNEWKPTFKEEHDETL